MKGKTNVYLTDEEFTLIYKALKGEKLPNTQEVTNLLGKFEQLTLLTTTFSY